MKRAWEAFAAVTAAALAVCGAAAERPLNVMATTTPVGDVVRRVGGEDIALTVLIPPGADPHAWQPRPADVARMTRADVVFTNGLGLEEFLAPVLRMPEIAPRTVALSEGIEPRRFGGKAHGHGHAAGEPDGGHGHGHAHGEAHGHDDGHARERADDAAPQDGHAGGGHAHHGHQTHGHHHEAGEPDPHVWFDPAHLRHWAARVEQALAARRPERAEAFAARRARFDAEMEELDAWIRTEVAAIPPERRVLATDHEVLGYFADRYGFRLAGTVIPGLSTLAQPSARELARFERRLRDEGIPALFVGVGTNPAIARRISADTGVPVVALYTGALSGPDGPAPDLAAFLRHNVRAIVRALR